MATQHRRSISYPDATGAGFLAALARATGLASATVRDDADLDLGFASAVVTDDSADDSSSDDPESNRVLRHARGRVYSTSAVTTDEFRHRRRAASSSFVGGKEAVQSLRGTSQRLEYLDLPPSLPLALSVVRDTVLAQLNALEARLGSISLAPDSATVNASKAAFHAHLVAVRDQLHLLLTRIPAATPDLGHLSARLPRPSMPVMPQGMQGIPARLLTEVSAPLASLKAHLEAANEAVSASFRGSMPKDMEETDNHSFPDMDVLLRLKTSEAVRGMELCLAELGTGAKRAVTKAASTAEEIEARLYAAALDLASGGKVLIKYTDLPVLWRNNEYILTGYRFIPLQRWPKLVASTFEWHNESGNVWTHLIGIALVLAAPWMFDAPASAVPGSAPTAMDKIMSWVYIGAAVKCMALSVSWHVMAGCSDFHAFNLFACVDYTGIAWLISASVWTVVYNLFYWQPNIIWAYVMATFSLAVVCTIVPFIPWFNKRENKQYRIVIFVALAGVGALPLTHAAYAHGVTKTAAYLSAMVPSISAYVAGLLFYATHFPESWCPGRFDYLGHAHQIWHAAIVLAVLLHYRSVQVWHAERSAYANPSMDTFDPSPDAAMTAKTIAAVTAVARQVGQLFPFLPNYRDNQVLLTTVDEAVLGFRRTLGALGGGAVGRVYTLVVGWASKVLTT